MEQGEIFCAVIAPYGLFIGDNYAQLTTNNEFRTTRPSYRIGGLSAGTEQVVWGRGCPPARQL